MVWVTHFLGSKYVVHNGMLVFSHSKALLMSGSLKKIAPARNVEDFMTSSGVRKNPPPTAGTSIAASRSRAVSLKGSVGDKALLQRKKIARSATSLMEE